MAILDFDRFEVRRNLIFHNSSRRPQMVRFVLVTLKAAFPSNLSSIRRIQILTDLRSAKLRFFTTRPGELKMVRFVLVTLTAAKPANLSLKKRFLILTDLRSPTIRFFTTRPGYLKMLRFVLVTLRAA